MTSIAEAGTPILHDGFEIAVRLADGQVFDYCKRCGGSGQYSFNGFDSICYGCSGSGLGKATTELDAIKRANARWAAARKRRRTEQARMAKQEIERAAWAAQHPELAEELGKVVELYRDEDPSILGVGVLLDLAQQAAWRPLSPAQTELATKLVIQFTARQQATQERQERQAAAGHIGTVGEKVELDVEIVYVKSIESSFNGRPTYSWLVIMKTAEGATVKTFSSGDFGIRAEKGQQVRIKGTVKAHEERDGLPETNITRVKLV
jgi:hypothetical protein